MPGFGLPFHLFPPFLCLQEEAVKAGKVREQTAARLQLLEKQKATVELARDELKVSTLCAAAATGG